MEEQRATVEKSLTNLIEDINKLYLRRLQGNTYKCAAKCCEDSDASSTSIQKCIDNCGTTLNSAQNFVQSEINHLQDRLQRCIMSCNDTIKDKMGSQPNELEISKYTREFETCSGKCIDAHLKLISNMMKKMKDVFKQEYSQ